VTGGSFGGTTGRRAIAVTILQTVGTSGVLLFLYYEAPLDRALDPVSGLLFVLALALFGAVVGYQVRSILRSSRPRLRAIRALGVAVPLLLVVFASTYFVVATQEAGAFSEPLNRTDSLYFTVTVFSTVGLGDIAPVTQLARILVTVQMLVGLIAVGLIAKLVLGAVQVAVARKARTPEPEPVGEGSPDQP
jgi:voltage-gated potassium channel